MLFSFQKLIRKCVHKDKKEAFHNQLDIKKLRELFTFLHAKFQEWNSKTFDQIRKLGKRECRELSPQEKETKSKEFAHLSDSREIERTILGNPLYQLRINEQIRLVGIVEKDYFEARYLSEEKRINVDLFSVLYYDFHHTSHLNLTKKQPKKADLVCLLDEKCPLYFFVPSEK